MNHFHLCLFEYVVFLVCIGIYHIRVNIPLCFLFENDYEPVQRRRFVNNVERIAKRIALQIRS